MIKITGASVVDLRYPTSRQLDGSDAMNPDPDYSAAYLRLHTSDADLTGHGFAFSIGRGNDLQVAAIESLADRLVGRDVDGLCRRSGCTQSRTPVGQPTSLVRPGQGRNAHGNGCGHDRCVGSPLSAGTTSVVGRSASPDSR